MSSVISSSAVTFINPPGLYDPRPNGYSHVAVASAPARWVYVAGQGGEDASGHLPDDFAAQVQQALHNLVTALGAADARLGDVVKLTVLIVDHSLERFEHWQRSVRLHWGSGEPGDARPRFPACTLIPVPKLALPGMLIEVEATAATPIAALTQPVLAISPAQALREATAA